MNSSFNNFLVGYSSLIPDDILLYIYVETLILQYRQDTIDYLCEKGKLEILKYMTWAAGGGHLEVVKWLYENRTEGCTKYAISLADMHGHTDVVKWLQENNDKCNINSILYQEIYA